MSPLLSHSQDRERQGLQAGEASWGGQPVQPHRFPACPALALSPLAGVFWNCRRGAAVLRLSTRWSLRHSDWKSWRGRGRVLAPCAVLAGPGQSLAGAAHSKRLRLVIFAQFKSHPQGSACQLCLISAGFRFLGYFPILFQTNFPLVFFFNLIYFDFVFEGIFGRKRSVRKKAIWR